MPGRASRIGLIQTQRAAPDHSIVRVSPARRMISGASRDPAAPATQEAPSAIPYAVVLRCRPRSR